MQHYIYIKGVFGVATELLRSEVDYSQIDVGQRTMSKLGIISKAGSRDLRPTVEQMTKVVSLAHSRRMKWAESNNARKDIIPMDKIIVFAMLSARRHGEFSRMLRSNTDYERKRVLIPDMKHPTKKIGRDVWVSISEEAWKVLLCMPVNEDKPDNCFLIFTAPWVIVLGSYGRNVVITILMATMYVFMIYGMNACLGCLSVMAGMMSAGMLCGLLRLLVISLGSH